MPRDAVTPWLRSPLFRRVFPALALLAALPLAATLIASLSAGRRVAGNEALVRLRSDAALLREAVRDDIARGDGAAVDARCKKLGEELATRFTVLDSSGKVLGDSDHDPKTMENHAHRPEIDRARETGEGSVLRYSDTLNKDMVYVAVRVERGFVRAALPASFFATQFQSRLQELGAVAAPAALLAIVALALTLRTVVRALGEVTSVARSVAAGGPLSRMASTAREDEIGELARSVRDMGDELARRVAVIERERNEVAAIVASMGEGLLAVDAGARVLLSNRAAADLLGTKPLVAGAPLADAVPHGAVVAAVRDVLSGKTDPTLVEIVGESRVVFVRGSRVEGGGAVVVLRDVTEEARYERLRREFVANVSHELRTPLALVKGFLETLEDGALADPEKGPRFVGIAARHVLALERLVDDLLALSALDAGAETRPPSPVDATELVESVTAGFCELVARRGLSLEVTAAPGVKVLGHREHLERALRNLIDNAVKYTEKGQVSVSVALEGARVVLAVADTGRGIPQESLGRIFERFYRVEKSRTREAGGTGLGLAIVKHIAQQEGGTVSVESELGKGSTFRIVLPAA